MYIIIVNNNIFLDKMSNFSSIKRKNEALDILMSYSGQNPYIMSVKNDVVLYKKQLNDFNTEYIIKNHDVTPLRVDKIVRIADWFSQIMMDKYNIDFLPEKLKIIAYIGETDTQYHLFIQYRMSINPQMMFIPKKAILGDFLSEDYHNVQVDFERYNTLLHRTYPERNLREHQKEGVQFLLSRKKCILADDMGLGKSMELSVASIEGNFDAILIICPASLKTNWKNELMNFVPERDITIIEGFNDKTKQELEKYLGYGIGKSGKTVKELREEAKSVGKWQDNRYVIVNFDILDEFYEFEQSRSNADKEKSFENSPILQYISNKKSLIIVDEAHKLSNSDSGRYKIIQKLIKRGNPESIYLATGTPITNTPENLYNLLKLIGSNVADDWEYFMNRYCGAMKIPAKGEKARWTNEYLRWKKKNSWYDLSSQEKDDLKDFIKNHARMITIPKDATNLDELKDRISSVYIRRLKEDLNDLPGKTVHEVFYDFTSEQKAQYDRLWEEYEAAQLELDPTKEINKDLLEGAVYRKFCSNQMVEKTIRVTNHFISKGEKVIIACCYDEELYTLKDYYDDKCVIYNGKMSQKEKNAAEKAFMTDDSKMVFIGNIQAAGVGLTLTKSHIMVFNNISWVPGDNSQMCDRIYRMSQTHDCDIYYQFFAGTQYEKMWNTILRKQLTIDSVIKTEKEKK